MTSKRRKLVKKGARFRTPDVKWAQKSPQERAWDKLHARDVEQWGMKYYREILTMKDARSRNRYYQLLRHWIKVKEANEPKSE